MSDEKGPPTTNQDVSKVFIVLFFVYVSLPYSTTHQPAIVGRNCLVSTTIFFFPQQRTDGRPLDIGLVRVLACGSMENGYGDEGLKTG